MAGEVVERLIIEIGGDARKFKEELKSLQKSNKKGEESFKKLALVGKAGFLAVAAAAATLTVAATKSFIAFEKGVVSVAKTTNLAGQELEDFKKEIMDLSEEIPQTTDQLLEIATAAGQLGIKGTKNLVIFTETIAKLGATTDLEGEAAAIGIARILDLTGEAIDTVDEFGSVIVDLGNNFATSESQILAVATEVAKATVNFGLSSPEVLGLSAAMSSLGIQSEAGATVVGKAFQKIDEVIRKQAGPQFEKLIELSGMTGEELTKTFQTDSTKVFESFIKGLGAAGQSGKSMTAELNALGLSGIRVEKILPTLAERSDKLADALKRSGKAAKENSALNKEAATAFESSAARLAIAQNKINNALIEIGAETAPAVVEAIEGISSAVRENSGAINGIATAIGFFLKSVIFIFGQFGKTVGAFIDRIKQAGKFVSDIVFTWTGAFMHLWEVSTMVFKSVGVIIDDFTKFIGGEFDRMSGKITAWVETFREKTGPVQEIASKIMGIFFAVEAVTIKIFDSINNKIGEFVDFFRDKITKVQGWVSSVTPDFLKFGDDAAEGVKKAAGAVDENSKSIIESVSDLIKKYRDAGAGLIASDDEVTAKTEENKNKRVESQKEETEATRAAARSRADAVIAIAEEQKTRQEELDAARLARQGEMNALELQIIKAQGKNAEKSEVDALQAKFDKLKEINDLNNKIIALKSKGHLTELEQQTLDHLQVVFELKQNARTMEAETMEMRLAEIRKGEKTRSEVVQDGIIEREKARVKEHNQRLKDEVEFGAKFAALKQIQHSAEYQGTKNAASSLAVLINSENDNLAAIGKAATIVQLGISTAESAMKAYAGLAWIPVVGVGLGILAAGAITAYGAEQVNNVRKMQDGGIVPGSGRGDKVPALLEPGELVVPRDVTAELMKKLGARQMAEGGVAQGSKENKAMYQTFADMFNPAVFIKALVHEYLGFGDDAGEGANSASGFGAGMFGGVIGGVIKIGEGALEELGNLVLDEIPGGDYIQKIAKWAQIPKDELKEIFKDIAGEGPLFDFLDSIDSEVSGFLFDEFIKFSGSSLGAIAGIGDIGEGIGDTITGALGFQNGGLVPGSGSGDIVPAFLEPGELVVPKDLTSSLLSISSGFGGVQIPVSNQTGGGSATGEKSIFVEISLNDNAAEVINAQIREGDRLGYLNRN